MKKTRWINRDNRQVNDKDPLWQIDDNLCSWEAIEQLQGEVGHRSRRFEKALKQLRRDVAKLQERGAPNCGGAYEDTLQVISRFRGELRRCNQRAGEAERERDEALELLREGRRAVAA